MRVTVERMGAFLRTLKDCMAAARRDADAWYHIPKSRFRDHRGKGNPGIQSASKRRSQPRNAFLGSFWDCVLKAWEDSDTYYHIPKSRYLDREYNGSAYRTLAGPGVVKRSGIFLKTLKNCMATAWQESDHYYHLPKSRYRDEVFVKEKMRTAPRPRGPVVMQPLFAGRGKELGDNGKDRAAAARQEGSEELYFISDEGMRKPEIRP